MKTIQLVLLVSVGLVTAVPAPAPEPATLNLQISVANDGLKGLFANTGDPCNRNIDCFDAYTSCQDGTYQECNPISNDPWWDCNQWPCCTGVCNSATSKCYVP